MQPADKTVNAQGGFSSFFFAVAKTGFLIILFEPRREKTRLLPMRTQRRRSAVQ